MASDNSLFGNARANSYNPEMVLSGSELLEAELTPAKRGGLEPQPVREALIRAARTIDSLYEQLWRGSDEYNSILAELERTKSQLSTSTQGSVVAESSRILAAADRTASEVIAQAQAEAEIIRASAAQERTRTAAEVNEAKRLAREDVARIEAQAESRRMELEGHIRDAEQRSLHRIGEIERGTAEVALRVQVQRERLEAEVLEYSETADGLRRQLEAQLEEFRAAAERERQRVIGVVIAAADALRGFQPSGMWEPESPSQFYDLEADTAEAPQETTSEGVVDRIAGTEIPMAVLADVEPVGDYETGYSASTNFNPEDAPAEGINIADLITVDPEELTWDPELWVGGNELGMDQSTTESPAWPPSGIEMIMGDPPVVENHAPVIEVDPWAAPDGAPVIMGDPPVVENHAPVIEVDPWAAPDGAPVIMGDESVVENHAPVIEVDPWAAPDGAPVIMGDESAIEADPWAAPDGAPMIEGTPFNDIDASGSSD